MRRVILNFHGIGTPARDLEEGEAPYWVTPEFFQGTLDLAERHKASVQTYFTFDDGNASDIEIAAPLLTEQGHKARFFVLSNRIDQPGSLSGADMRALVKMGHMIGNHGAAHVDWKVLDTAGQAREFDEAREAIAAAAGTEITEAAIPFGRYNGAVLKALKARGYARSYSSDGGAWTHDCAPIPRTSPRADMTLDDIEAIMLGHEPMKTTLRRRLARAVKRRI